MPLFQIQRRRAFFTPEGEALLIYTERIFNPVGEAEQAVAATHSLERGRLRIAASPTIGVHVLPPILRDFHDRYPGIQVHVGVDRSEDIVAQVLAQRIPFGLVEGVVNRHSGLAVQPFARDEMILIAPGEHPWARAGRVSRASLRKAPVLRRQAGSGLRVLLDRQLEQAGLSLETAMELGTTETIIAAVRAGVGVAWVPRITVVRDAEMGHLAIIEVPGVQPHRSLSVVSLEGTPLTGAARAFLQILRESAATPVRV